VAFALIQGRAEAPLFDSLIFIGAGMSCAGLVALINPMLLGWRSRRDALVVLTLAVFAISLGWLPRLW
jgi:hypothetical protein